MALRKKKMVTLSRQLRDKLNLEKFWRNTSLGNRFHSATTLATICGSWKPRNLIKAKVFMYAIHFHKLSSSSRDTVKAFPRNNPTISLLKRTWFLNSRQMRKALWTQSFKNQILSSQMQSFLEQSKGKIQEERAWTSSNQTRAYWSSKKRNKTKMQYFLSLKAIRSSYKYHLVNEAQSIKARRHWPLQKDPPKKLQQPDSRHLWHRMLNL